MGDFFKPWRRKFGSMTLVMACLFAAGWVRAHSMLDLLTLATNNNFWRITIEDSVVELSRYEYVSGEPPRLTNANGKQNSWTSDSNVSADGTKSRHGYAQANVATADKKLEFGGFAYATRQWNGPAFVVETSFFVFPYWFIVIPLTLLSAGLLVWRTPNPMRSPAEPTSAIGV